MSGELADNVIELRRYPNRRYYDATHSKYVTLPEIHDLIVAGRNVHVTDAKTEEDITLKVLAQIILEHESPKLQIFPSALLHQLIRVNEMLVQGFVQSFFNNALVVFMESQRLFDRYLQTGGERLGTETAISPPASPTAPPPTNSPPETTVADDTTAASASTPPAPALDDAATDTAPPAQPARQGKRSATPVAG